MLHPQRFYECRKCGHIIQIFHDKSKNPVIQRETTPLTCCGNQLHELTESTSNQFKDEWSPIIEQTEARTLVKIGTLGAKKIAQLLKIYVCAWCGCEFEVIRESKMTGLPREGGGKFICCDRKLELIKEQNCASPGYSWEFIHPSITIEGIQSGFGEIKTVVKVGNPNKIEWIQLITVGKAFRKFILPEEQFVEATFPIWAGIPIARVYSSLVGLWISEEISGNPYA